MTTAECLVAFVPRTALSQGVVLCKKTITRKADTDVFAAILAESGLLKSG
jgi:hypothetical protein